MICDMIKVIRVSYHKSGGCFIMMKTVILDRDQKPTQEQIRSIHAAAKRKIVFDEDSPDMTPKMEEAFRMAARKRNINRKMDVS